MALQSKGMDQDRSIVVMASEAKQSRRNCAEQKAGFASSLALLAMTKS
jgi:hypothetical protein